MNTIVNFEIAKLLKEKGMQFPSGNGVCTIIQTGNVLKTDGTIWQEKSPTIAEVVMWLYEKHGIWIAVWKYRDYAADCNDDYRFKHNYSGSTTFKTPTEAYSAAILYTSNNLT